MNELSNGAIRLVVSAPPMLNAPRCLLANTFLTSGGEHIITAAELSNNQGQKLKGPFQDHAQPPDTIKGLCGEQWAAEAMTLGELQQRWGRWQQLQPRLDECCRR